MDELIIPGFRIGEGYDAHRLERGRKLLLGGVEIPHRLGLLGHSDADVLLHAIMDALLGAAALGDIGRHFPDSDKKYENISSIELLLEVVQKIKREGFSIVNLDATIIAEEPKISPYVRSITEKIAETLCIAPGRINVKATTTEKMGFEGRHEGISARCVCLLYKDNG